MDLSVVIITWNQANKLEKCLNSIFSQKIKCTYEIMIVNNNSQDRTKEVLEKYKSKHQDKINIEEFEKLSGNSQTPHKIALNISQKGVYSKLSIINNRENRGIALARNQGITISKGKYVMMLDDDTEVLENCFDSIVNFMNSHEDAWCAGTKQLKPDRSLEYNARKFYTIPSILFRRSFLVKIFPNSRFLKDHLYLDWDHNSSREVDWVAGASFIMRREAIDKIGLFDENYFFGFEDVDWCYRVKLAEKKTYYISEAVIIHHVQGSSRKLLSRKALNHLKSAIRFLVKFNL